MVLAARRGVMPCRGVISRRPTAFNTNFGGRRGGVIFRSAFEITMLFVKADRYYSADRPTQNHVRNLERGRGGVPYCYAPEETFVTAECDFGVVSLHIGRSYVLQVAVFAVAVAIDQHLCLHAQVRAPVSACLCVRVCV